MYWYPSCKAKDRNLPLREYCRAAAARPIARHRPIKQGNQRPLAVEHGKRRAKPRRASAVCTRVWLAVVDLNLASGPAEPGRTDTDYGVFGCLLAFTVLTRGLRTLRWQRFDCCARFGGRRGGGSSDGSGGGSGGGGGGGGGGGTCPTFLVDDAGAIFGYPVRGASFEAFTGHQVSLCTLRAHCGALLIPAAGVTPRGTLAGLSLVVLATGAGKGLAALSPVLLAAKGDKAFARGALRDTPALVQVLLRAALLAHGALTARAVAGKRAHVAVFVGAPALAAVTICRAIPDLAAHAEKRLQAHAAKVGVHSVLGHACGAGIGALPLVEERHPAAEAGIRVARAVLADGALLALPMDTLA